MKILLDTSAETFKKKKYKDKSYIGGQLLTPSTRYTNAGLSFAIDNGAYSRFDEKSFLSLLVRETPNKQKCLFVCCPDVVGDGLRTLELFRRRKKWIVGWPVAFVAQNGVEKLDIPWDDFECLFIGGTDPWKESRSVLDLIKTALILNKHVHVGRINGAERFDYFAEEGVHTCDGSGLARFDHMIRTLLIYSKEIDRA